MPRCPDAQMPRCPDAQMPRCPDAQMPRCPDAQMPRCPDAQTPRRPDAQTPRRPDAGKRHGFRSWFDSSQARQTVRWGRFWGLLFAPVFAVKPGGPHSRPGFGASASQARPGAKAQAGRGLRLVLLFFPRAHFRERIQAPKNASSHGLAGGSAIERVTKAARRKPARPAIRSAARRQELAHWQTAGGFCKAGLQSRFIAPLLRFFSRFFVFLLHEHLLSRFTRLRHCLA